MNTIYDLPRFIKLIIRRIEKIQELLIFRKRRILSNSPEYACGTIWRTF